MPEVPNVDGQPVQLGNFPIGAYEEYEQSRGVQSISPIQSEEVATRSTVASTNAILSEFSKLSSRFSKLSDALVEPPYDLNMAKLFLPHTISASFENVREMSERLGHFLTTRGATHVQSSGKQLKAFVDEVAELNDILEKIHIEMSRINKG